MTRFVILALVALVAPCLGLAQAAAYQVPKPGPEHEKLGGLVGNWTGEGDCVASPSALPRSGPRRSRPSGSEGRPRSSGTPIRREVSRARWFNSRS